MTNKDASFLLGACRPNGSDSSDPEFAEALAQAGSDPALKEWCDDQHRFDSAIAARLQALPVPADLRSRILTGGRVSRPARWSMSPRIWAVAAVLAVFAGLAISVSIPFRRPSGPPQGIASLPDLPSAPSPGQWQDQALATLSDLVAGSETFDAKSPNVADLQQWLHANGSPVASDLPASVQRLASLGCKTVSWHGRPISIICFHGPGGELVHLAMTARSPLDNPGLEGHPIYATRNGWHIAIWNQADMAMMLVTRAPESQLRALLAFLP